MGEFIFPGRRVVHPIHGRGTVLQVLPRRRAQVRFDGERELPRTVWQKSLERGRKGVEKTRQAAAEPAAPRGAVATASVEPAACRLQVVMEALRLGVVPASHVEKYTVGRKREMADLDALLEEGRGMRLVWGDYGAGKTHMLDLAEHLALARGYVVGRLTLDPSELPASHPQRLFSAFIRSLRHPGGMERGWKPIFRRLAGSAEHLAPGGKSFSRYLSPVLHLLGSGDEEAVGWASDYIEGYPMDLASLQSAFRAGGWRGPRVLALPDYRTFGRVYTHLLGTLACWAKDAGHRGLVLLMDEMEYLDFLPRSVLRLAAEVLMHFAAATLEPERLRFDPGDLYRGGHALHRNLDIRYRKDQPLVALMALTPLLETANLAGHVVAEDDPVHLRLRELDEEDLKTLLRKVWGLYRRAYPDFESDAVEARRVRRWIVEEQVDSLEGVSPREAVRDAVLMFDALRWGRSPYPQRKAAPWDEMDGLLEEDEEEGDEGDFSLFDLLFLR